MKFCWQTPKMIDNLKELIRKRYDIRFIVKRISNELQSLNSAIQGGLENGCLISKECA
jgi:hypothetical protein